MRNPKHLAISNTGIKAKDDQLVIFEPTPLMSSYLFVCIVGKYERIEGEHTNDGIIIGGYTPVGYS